MADVSGAKLAFETCRAGGLGFIAAGHLNSKEAFKKLEHEIETFKEMAAAAKSNEDRIEYPLCIGFISHSTFKEELGWNLVQHLLEDYEPDGEISGKWKCFVADMACVLYSHWQFAPQIYFHV